MARSRRTKIFVLIGIGSFVALNCMAYMHAWRMCHFSDSTERTPAPHELSFLDKAKVLITGVAVPRPANSRDPRSVGLPFEVVRYAGHAGAQLESWFVPAAGSGVGAILFPGYAASKSSLLDEAVLFHGLGFDVLLVDFYGAGGSSGSTTSIGFHEADDVARSIAYARDTLHLEPVLLFGRSMGSAAVLRAIAKLDATPRALVLESPFSTLISTVRNRFTSMGLPSFPAADVLVFWGGIISGSETFAHNPVDYARTVTAPTLVMYGSNDPYARPDEARLVFDSLRGVKYSTEFPGAAHENLLSHDRQKWRGSVDRLLASAGLQPAPPRQPR